MKSSKILILGASSWIGYLLTQVLCCNVGFHILGTIHSSKVNLPDNAMIYRINSYDDYEPLLHREQPNIIIDLLRGEDEADFELHKKILEYSYDKGIYYVYASSVFALDAYLGKDLTESLPPRSNSPYGIFKGRCETCIQESGVSYLILRFASIHGWVPHKITRTQKFLNTVSVGKSVMVDTGVMQNRLFANDLVKILVELLFIRAEGVFHLGTEDLSSEVDFLRKQAEVFGWDPNLVLEGKARNINLVAKPGKIYDLFGERFRKTEQDTLQALLNCTGLSRFKNKKNSA